MEGNNLWQVFSKEFPMCECEATACSRAAQLLTRLPPGLLPRSPREGLCRWPLVSLDGKCDTLLAHRFFPSALEGHREETQRSR